MNSFHKYFAARAWRRLATGLIAMVVVCYGATGCHRADRDAGKGRRKTYPLRGVVVSVDYAKGEVVLNQDAIPGLMSAMTTTYPLTTPGVLAELRPGDTIAARLWAASDASGGTQLRLDRVEVSAQARPDKSPKVQYHVPAAGDVVPEFPLLNQNGRTIRLSDFRGKVVVLTFIHTRCEIANYCPRMSRDFAEIDKALAADPAVYAKTHLVSISFDPAYDTPQVLQAYSAAYIGNNGPQALAHWDFAAPSAADLSRMEQFFNLKVTGEGAALVHSLATVVIGKDGKVLGYSPNSDWKTSDLLTQIRAAAR